VILAGKPYLAHFRQKGVKVISGGTETHFDPLEFLRIVMTTYNIFVEKEDI
jgi:hypothetical protein